jgi:RNA-directed DNA polymerase
MGLLEWIGRLLRGGPPELRSREPMDAPRPSATGGRAAPETGLALMDLSSRLGRPISHLQAIPVEYTEFTIRKRSGGRRTILAPAEPLKQLQRRILRRLFARLRSHPAAMGFERGRSIVTNARVHVGSAVVLRMDVRDFFASTDAARVRGYFQAIGWGSEAVYLLSRWCTVDGGLPQGAPTSPRLSNLVNFALDARLAGVAKAIGAAYTRYADDITFSFPTERREAVYNAIRMTKRILADCGYRLHTKRKLSIRRRHQRQEVTGLVVNEDVKLPRETRRRLRAAAHRLATGREATLTPRQLAGWAALMRMVDGSTQR